VVFLYAMLCCVVLWSAYTEELGPKVVNAVVFIFVSCKVAMAPPRLGTLTDVHYYLQFNNIGIRDHGDHGCVCVCVHIRH
jgi:hypothetical protein